MTRLERRLYDREWHRRARAAKLEAARRGRQSCPQRFGRGTCGGRLEAIVLPGGRVEVACERCERYKAGLCIECGFRVYGTPRKAIYCRHHFERAKIRSANIYRETHRAKIRRASRLRMRRLQKERVEYNRLWRLANPDKVAAQKRRYDERHRAEVRAYQVQYRQTHVAPPGPRTCLTPGCRVIVHGRRKKCSLCKAAARAALEAAA